MFRQYLRRFGPKWLQAAGVAALAYLTFALIARHALPWLAHQPESGTAPPLNIKSLLREVKTQVDAAVKEGVDRGEPAMFEVKELELEINFVITEEGAAKTPTLVPISLESKVASQKVQRVKLTLSAAGNLHDPWTADPVEKTAETTQTLPEAK